MDKPSLDVKFIPPEINEEKITQFLQRSVSWPYAAVNVDYTMNVLLDGIVKRKQRIVYMVICSRECETYSIISVFPLN